MLFCREVKFSCFRRYCKEKLYPKKLQRKAFNAFGEISIKAIMLSERFSKTTFLSQKFTRMSILSQNFAFLHFCLKQLFGILSGPRKAANFCHPASLYTVQQFFQNHLSSKFRSQKFFKEWYKVVKINSCPLPRLFTISIFGAAPHQ